MSPWKSLSWLLWIWWFWCWSWIWWFCHHDDDVDHVTLEIIVMIVTNLMILSCWSCHPGNHCHDCHKFDDFDVDHDHVTLEMVWFGDFVMMMMMMIFSAWKWKWSWLSWICHRQNLNGHNDHVFRHLNIQENSFCFAPGYRHFQCPPKSVEVQAGLRKRRRKIRWWWWWWWKCRWWSWWGNWWWNDYDVKTYKKRWARSPVSSLYSF